MFLTLIWVACLNLLSKNWILGREELPWWSRAHHTANHTLFTSCICNPTHTEANPSQLTTQISHLETTLGCCGQVKFTGKAVICGYWTQALSCSKHSWLECYYKLIDGREFNLNSCLSYWFLSLDSSNTCWTRLVTCILLLKLYKSFDWKDYLFIYLFCLLESTLFHLL